jgi:hypothetical protein
MKDSHSRGRPFLGLLFGVVGWTLGCWPLTAATVTVTIYSSYFSPSTVTINVNDSVEWFWATDYHTTTSTTGLWDSGLYTTGYTYTYKFNNAGSFPYSCTYHGFTGTIMVQAVNVPPSIIITNPPNGQVLSAPVSLTLGATATDADGSVTNVQFFQGSTSLGNVASAPYSKAVTGLSAGSYTFSAVASDNGGLTATNSVSVSVINPSPLTVSAPRWVSATSFAFSYAADVGLRYVVQRSPDLKNWIGIGTNAATTNPVVFQDNNASGAAGFYRVWRLPNP